MKQEIKILIISIIVFLLNYVYLLWPESTETFSYFKYNSQLLTKQAYVDYLCRIVQMIVIYYTLSSYIPKYRESLFLIGVLWLGYLIDYKLTYNQPWGWYGIIPLSYAFFMGIAMILILLYKILTTNETE